MMGVFVYREFVLPASLTQVFAERTLRPQNVWMGIFINGDRQVGFVNSRSAPEFRNSELGFSYGVTTQLNIPLFGRGTDFRLLGKAWLSKTDGLRDFEFSLSSGDFDMKVKGEVKDGKLTSTLLTGGEEIPFTFPISENLLLGGDMGFAAMEMPRLEPGQVAYVETFDPTTMSIGKAKLECTGKETLLVMGADTECFVMEMSIGGMKSKAWVTAEDEVVQASTPFGFTMRKISPDEAFSQLKDNEDSADFMKTMAVIPNTPISRDLSMLKLKFSGISEENYPLVNSAQTRDGDIYTIRKLEAPQQLDDPFTGLEDAEKNEALSGDAFVQVGHEKILAKAKEIVGEEKDVWKQSILLYNWLYGNIEKTMVISLPSALDVLEHMKGDCNEHTILYAALARSVGIPTRIAIGLVWSEELNGFGYHAWPEVYYGQWRALDPTLGQEETDPTHITLLYGSLEKWAQLIPYIGQVKVEILETDPPLNPAKQQGAGL